MDEPKYDPFLDKPAKSFCDPIIREALRQQGLPPDDLQVAHNAAHSEVSKLHMMACAWRERADSIRSALTESASLLEFFHGAFRDQIKSDDLERLKRAEVANRKVLA